MEVFNWLINKVNMKSLEIQLNNKYPKRNIIWKNVDVRNYISAYDSQLPNISGESDDEKAINGLKWVVKNIEYVSDSKQYKMSEFWAHPYQTQHNKQGDCEDGALLLYSILLKAGVPYWKMRITCGDSVVGGHAYLTYYHEDKNRWVTLDWTDKSSRTNTENLKDWKEDRLYGNVWFSFNQKYCFSKEDKLGIKGIKITKEVLKEMVFDWKKTGWKFVKASAYVILAGAAVVYSNNPYYLAVAPGLHALENWLKNR